MSSKKYLPDLIPIESTITSAATTNDSNFKKSKSKKATSSSSGGAQSVARFRQEKSIGVEAEEVASQISVSNSKTENDKSVYTNTTAETDISDLKKMFIACSQPGSKHCPKKQSFCPPPPQPRMDCIPKVRTIHVYKKPCPLRIPESQHCRTPPPCPEKIMMKPCQEVCPPKNVVQVICVDQKLPKNLPETHVQTIYKSNAVPDPCVQKTLCEQQSYLNPVTGMDHMTDKKKFDHCKMALGDSYSVLGRGVVCHEDGIFDIKHSTNFFESVLAEDARRVISRQNAALDFFNCQFGVDFHGKEADCGIIRTEEAQMYPFRIPADIRTQVILSSDGIDTKTQVRVYQGGFAVQILMDIQAGGQYSADNGGDVILKKGTFLFYGLKKLQRFDEMQENVDVLDPKDPCKMGTHCVTKWIATGNPLFVSFKSEKPTEPQMNLSQIWIRSAIESGNMIGYANSLITWEKVCDGIVNVVLQESWSLEDKNKAPTEDEW